MARVLGLGDNTVDTYVDLGRQYPGGNAVNVAVLSRRLGAETSYIGCLGDDAAGDLLLDALAAEGVDLRRVRRAGGANARAFIGHVGGDRRFLSSEPGSRAAYRLEADDFDMIAAHDLTHTSVHSELDAMLPAVKRSAPLLSYDMSEKWNAAALVRVAPHVDLLFLSDPEGSQAASESLARSAAALGPSTVVVTRGPAETLAIIEGEIHCQRIVRTEVVDTLGAGDGFIAGFIVALLGGSSAASALAAGAAAAALVCTYHGAFGRGADWSPADARLQATR